MARTLLQIKGDETYHIADPTYQRNYHQKTLCGAERYNADLLNISGGKNTCPACAVLAKKVATLPMPTFYKSWFLCGSSELAARLRERGFYASVYGGEAPRTKMISWFVLTTATPEIICEEGAVVVEDLHNRIHEWTEFSDPQPTSIPRDWQAWWDYAMEQINA